MRPIFVALLALLSVSMAAQEHKTATPAPPSTQSNQNPTPTELESTQLENLELKASLLSQEEASIPERRRQLTEQYGALIRKIESEHPGYVWNPQMHGLVPAPVEKPAEPEKKDEAPVKKDEAPRKQP